MGHGSKVIKEGVMGRYGGNIGNGKIYNFIIIPKIKEIIFSKYIMMYD